MCYENGPTKRGWRRIQEILKEVNSLQSDWMKADYVDRSFIREYIREKFEKIIHILECIQ